MTFPQALLKHLEKNNYISLPANSTPSARLLPKEAPKPAEVVSSGTGFFVTRAGDLLTNAHVIVGCTSITVNDAGNDISVAVVQQDPANDLALLRTNVRSEKVAEFKSSVRLGEEVAVYGYPLNGLLASGGNFTLGNVTALAGLGDDTREVQISAPVQAGNSGGSLLDYSAGVIGIVTSKLNAIRAAALTKDLAQNVNFAIKSVVVTSFLESAGVKIERSQSNERLSPPDIADRARTFTRLVNCWK